MKMNFLTLMLVVFSSTNLFALTAYKEQAIVSGKVIDAQQVTDTSGARINVNDTVVAPTRTVLPTSTPLPTRTFRPMDEINPYPTRTITPTLAPTPICPKGYVYVGVKDNTANVSDSTAVARMAPSSGDVSNPVEPSIPAGCVPIKTPTPTPTITRTAPPLPTIPICPKGYVYVGVKDSANTNTTNETARMAPSDGQIINPNIPAGCVPIKTPTITPTIIKTPDALPTRPVCPPGYVFMPTRPLTQAESAAVARMALPSGCVPIPTPTMGPTVYENCPRPQVFVRGQGCVMPNVPAVPAPPVQRNETTIQSGQRNLNKRNSQQ